MIKSKTGHDVPSDAGEVTKPGLYLRLYHGRAYPGAELSDWGTDGPLIGPLEHLHCAYDTELELGFESDADRERYFEWGAQEQDLKFHEDLILYNGVYYGDWCAFTEFPVVVPSADADLRKALSGLLNMVSDVLTDSQLDHVNCGRTIRQAIAPARAVLDRIKRGD